MAKKKFQFETFNGTPTDVLHSKQFSRMTLANREKLAFAKNKSALSKEDRLLLRGYAQACADKNRAYIFKKNRSKNYTGKKYYNKKR